MSHARRTEDSSRALLAVDWARVEKLEWVQPGLLARNWELTAEGGTVARVQSRGLWKQGFDAQTREVSWRIHEPMFGPVSIHRGEESEPIAVARIGWRGGGRIDRAAGPALEWRRPGWRSQSHVLANAERFPMFELRTGIQLFRAGGSLHLEDAGRELPDLEALILLGWSLLMIARRHAST
ncbi:MAG: hypothetical protein ABIS67_14010 [Candidatus Eisenbacteria bacterium]